jgi:DNA-binding protein YbaB
VKSPDNGREQERTTADPRSGDALTRLMEMAAEVPQWQTVARSDLGEVTITLDGSGRLTRLEISPVAHRDLSRERLELLVVEAVTKGYAEIELALEQRTMSILDGLDPDFA